MAPFFETHDVLDHIRIEKDFVLASDYQKLETLDFRNDSHCQAVQLATPADLRGALNLPNFLQMAVVRRYLINYFAKDVKGIEDAQTLEFVAAEGLSPDSKLFQTLPNAHNVVYGNNH